MTKLSAKARDAVAGLLETHAELCRAENKIGKRGISFGLTSSNENDDSDFVSVTISNKLAKAAIEQEKAVVAKELAKHGIHVA